MTEDDDLLLAQAAAVLRATPKDESLDEVPVGSLPLDLLDDLEAAVVCERRRTRESLEREAVAAQEHALQLRDAIHRLDRVLGISLIACAACLGSGIALGVLL